MQTESLIINARHELPLHKRLFSDTSTAMMWAFWLLLWRPVLVITGLVGIHHPYFVHMLLGFIGLEHYVTALLACAAALLLWSILPSEEVSETITKQTEDYARYFELSPATIETGRTNQICVVHHDEHGKITHIEAQ